MDQTWIGILLAPPIFAQAVKSLWLAAPLAAAILCAGLTPPARAEVRVSGAADALKVEARDATIDDVLRALQTSYKFRFQSSRPLSNSVSGIYTGSLSRVIMRLLDGQNYVMRASAGGLQLSIISSDQPVVRRQQQQTQKQDEPSKDCRYNDGERMIPVEC